jgi:hypothetical protein
MFERAVSFAAGKFCAELKVGLDGCIRECFVGNYRVDYGSRLLVAVVIEVDAWLRLPFSAELTHR